LKKNYKFLPFLYKTSRWKKNCSKYWGLV